MIEEISDMICGQGPWIVKFFPLVPPKIEMEGTEKTTSRFSPTQKRSNFNLLGIGDQALDRAPGWGWPELFIIVQYVSTGLLFIPGTQPFRSIIRALPYLMSGFLLLYYVFHWYRQRTSKWKMDTSALAEELDESSLTGKKQNKFNIKKVPFPFHGMQGWLIGVIFILLAGLVFHPNSHFQGGVGQVFFQIMIAAPAFWAVMVVQNRQHLVRLLTLTFATNLVSAILGILQVYYPEIFSPPALTTVDPEIRDRLTYTGPGGRQILRPCGLSDTPGYASYSGLFCGFLGIAMAFGPRLSAFARVFFLVGAGIGPVVLLLTQVRSLFIVLVLITILFAVTICAQRRFLQFQLISGIGLMLFVGAVAWAVNTGGQSISTRFSFLWGEQDYKDLANERGRFYTWTFEEHLKAYPLGAGVGRWGVMADSFNNDYTNIKSNKLHAEIQLTGWLYDGGYLLWIVYPMAIVFALLPLLRASFTSLKDEKTFWYAIVLALNLSVIIQAYSQPTFNTQFGVIFWFFSGAVIGLHMRSQNTSNVQQDETNDWRRYRGNKKELNPN